MIAIYTESINGRADWYHARATVGGRYYGAFMSTRAAAVMDVYDKLITAGELTPPGTCYAQVGEEYCGEEVSRGYYCEGHTYLI